MRKVWVVLVLFFAVYLVGSVTRTISDFHDNKDTLIRNSNGKYWESTGENLQAAIDDLGNDGGTIWVGSDITLSSELRLNYSHMTLDFEGNKVTLNGDISFIDVPGGIWYSNVRNVEVDVSNGQTKPVIYLELPPSMGWAKRVHHCLFENIFITNSYGESNDDYTGIHLNINVGTDSPAGHASFQGNTFKHIRMYFPKTAILLESDDCDAYGSGNTFEDIYVWNFETGVEFRIDPGASNLGFSQTLFDNVKLQSATRSKDGFKNITGNGNHFDHCLIWDWYGASSPNHEWSITNRADRTYICAGYISDILDEGTKTNVVNPI